MMHSFLETLCFSSSHILIFFSVPSLQVIFAAFQRGLNIHVFVDETRPRLQGAKLTAW